MKLTWTLDTGAEYSIDRKVIRSWSSTEELSEVDDLLLLVRSLLYAATYDAEFIEERIPNPWRDYEIVYPEDSEDEVDDDFEVPIQCFDSSATNAYQGTTQTSGAATSTFETDEV